MLVFDIGANVGYWSLANAPMCDQIITVEASPYTYERTVQMCAQNGKIVPINYAVCNNNGEDITFYHAHCDVLSTINKSWLTDESSRFYGQQYTEIICKTITIDRLIEMYGVPDLIKVDVEGGEYECLTSLSQKVNSLCFEYAVETNNITFKCLDYLQNLGYSLFYIQKGDEYTFRPQHHEYRDIYTTKNELSKLKPKDDWGMIWCK